MTLKQVVLPAPLGPTRPRISPRRMSKLTPSSACRPPNLSVRSLTSSRTSASAGSTGTPDSPSSDPSSISAWSISTESCSSSRLLSRCLVMRRPRLRRVSGHPNARMSCASRPSISDARGTAPAGGRA
ncbi:Uncharacterised protein [Mycobacteroides abscessus subsp. abscessus]|nr:Uncharacterised protein [Mycobacteroides abscessus subsp. abscessus]